MVSPPNAGRETAGTPGRSWFASVRPPPGLSGPATPRNRKQSGRSAREATAVLREGKITEWDGDAGESHRLCPSINFKNEAPSQGFTAPPADLMGRRRPHGAKPTLAAFRKPPEKAASSLKDMDMSIEGQAKEAAGFIKEELNEHGGSPESQRRAQEGRDLRNEGRIEDGKAPQTTEPGAGHPED